MWFMLSPCKSRTKNICRSQYSPKQNCFQFILMEIFSYDAGTQRSAAFYFKRSTVLKKFSKERAQPRNQQHSTQKWRCSPPPLYHHTYPLLALCYWEVQNAEYIHKVTKIPNVLINHKCGLDSRFNPWYLGKTFHKQENAERKCSKRGSSKAQRKRWKTQQIHLSFQIFKHFNKLNPNNIRLLKIDCVSHSPITGRKLRI